MERGYKMNPISLALGACLISYMIFAGGARCAVAQTALETQLQDRGQAESLMRVHALGTVLSSGFVAPPTQIPSLAFASESRSVGPAQGDKTSRFATVFTAERAQMLLRSLTIPGWGQASVGRKRSAALFGLTETGIWASFTAFRIQNQLRREASERTARLLAGIELNGRDEDFRRTVGAFLSSDQYNQLVVYRDAANIFLSDPAHYDPQKYREYIAAHELKGADSWAWQDLQSLLRYRGQRKDAHRAVLHANGALALAIINRLVSAFHAARVADSQPEAANPKHSWNLEAVPSDPADATAFRIGVRTRF